MSMRRATAAKATAEFFLETICGQWWCRAAGLWHALRKFLDTETFAVIPPNRRQTLIVCQRSSASVFF